MAQEKLGQADSHTGAKEDLPVPDCPDDVDPVREWPMFELTYKQCAAQNRSKDQS